MTDSIANWLRAQLDAEAEAAQRAFSGQADPENGWGAYRPEWQQHTTITPHVGIIHEAVQADHVVRWNPARALREIDAKRQVIAKYIKAVERMAELASLCERLKADGKDTFMPEMDRATAIHRRDVLYEVLQLHALPYADRPGYKESWRP